MPDEHMGEEATWHHAESQLKNALQRAGMAYSINEKDGAFYGPKIDFDVTDAIGRKWQCATIQLDYQLPERFDLKYIGADNTEHRPVVIHRAIFGSFERFIAILIEHYAGAFPVWLAPVQAMLIPIADRHVEYCKQVKERLGVAGLRVEIDASVERMNAKIRNAQMQKIPYMLVVGDREQEQGAVAVRLRSGEDLKSKSVDDFLNLASDAISKKN
jgi:threonyl-tRNA synthetase